MIYEVLSEKNIYTTNTSLMEKKNSCGKDGMLLSEVYDYYELNKDEIMKNIINKKYKCKLITLHEILDYKGKQRIIAKMCSIDRLLSKALTNILTEKFNNIFSSHSFAYREGYGIHEAINCIFEYVKHNQFVCFIDIRNYFDEINHEIMMNEVHKVLNDSIIESFIRAFLICEVEYDFMTSYKSKGLIQGNSLSPLLSNLYLNSLDHHLEKKSIQFVRYADNIYMFFDDKQQAYNYMNHVKQLLESRYLLNINKKKSGVYESTDIQYLGYKVQKNKNHFHIIKIKREKQKYYSSWYTSPLRYINHQYHILDDGILRKKDYHLLFENQQQKVQIPVEVVDHINIHSSIIFSSSFFEMMNNNNLIVNIFNNKGIYIDQFIPNRMKKSVYTTLNQALLYNDNQKRMVVAKKIVNASIHNERSNIKYYMKHKNNEVLSESIKQLTECLKQVNECFEYEKLLLIEARAKHIYYQTFSIFITNEDFLFHHWSKQPPMDNINALISFGNTVLYNMIANEIYKTTLDIRIGFLHASNFRKQSLNLDIADIFKPIIIDRTIFTMINKKMITNKHFEKRNNGIYLTSQGKSLFLNQIQQKMQTHIQYKKENNTYSSIIRNNIYTLLQHINNNKKLQFYKYQ